MSAKIDGKSVKTLHVLITKRPVKTDEGKSVPSGTRVQVTSLPTDERGRERIRARVDDTSVPKNVNDSWVEAPPSSFKRAPRGRPRLEEMSAE